MSEQKKSSSRFCEEPWGITYTGFLQIACTTFKPEFFLSFTGNELKLALYLSFLRWKFPKRAGRIRATYSYLAAGTGLSEGTLKRVVKSLRKKQMLQIIEVDCYRGNLLLIHSVLFWKEKETSNPDQNDPTPRSFWTGSTGDPDQNDPTPRSFWTGSTTLPGTYPDQNDLQSNTNTKRDDDALRQRSPNGQDRMGGQEKGALSGSLKTEVDYLKAGLHPEGRPLAPLA